MSTDMTPTPAAAPSNHNVNANTDTAASSSHAENGTITATLPVQNEAVANPPPPKTDKPRPHVCGTCARSFARLEHLKRHERSHTKEKPFECSECTRCFARRDLLLRHQQKLHLTTTLPSKSRSARRESGSAMGANPSGRVRKNSTAGIGGTAVNGASSMRPRANTISTFDGATLGMMAAASRSESVGNDMVPGVHPPFNMNGSLGNYEPRGMSSALGNHGNPHNLPKLATNGLGYNIGGGLRTAPPATSIGGFDNQMFPTGHTINPAQLHMPDSAGPLSTFNQIFPTYHPVTEEEETFEWVPRFDAQMSFNPTHEQAIDPSSPSAMSTASPGTTAESNLEGSVPLMQCQTWPTSIAPQNMLPPNPFSLDTTTSTFPEYVPPLGTMSPKGLHDQGLGLENFYTTPSNFSPGSNGAGALPMHFYHPAMAYSTDGTSMSSSSISGSGRHSSVTSVSTDSITDATRQALLISLSQPSAFGRGTRKYSQPNVSSPLSPAKSTGYSASLPSTADLQRYVSAFIHYFHPHFPFLHIPTLSFDSPAYTSHLRPFNNNPHHGIVGGGGCLILAMAAIGALYEYDRTASRDLFEAAKKMIQLYLEERRKADMSATANGGQDTEKTTVQNTPLWLVQAMLLNVIYGINCADKVSSEIANTHCAALVSLARAAGLTREHKSYDQAHNFAVQTDNGDIQMGENGQAETWNAGAQAEAEQTQWYRWSEREERKRTLYGIFHLCSLLVSAYNHAPALMNSEIQLDLPCDEDLWAADSAKTWAAKGGAAVADAKAISFSTALSSLLSASQRQNEHYNMKHGNTFGSSVPVEELPESDLKPSTFGCLVLINALHNYIWETRQRHQGRQWTNEETESMHAYIEPALRAWQAAWASNPSHSLERPNPFGCGPLSADSIPLLDLAYVRLFVNLSSSKEALWQRDFAAMANELATGTEIIQHAENSEGSHTNNSSSTSNSGVASPQNNGDSSSSNILKTAASSNMIASPMTQTTQDQAQTSKRERHLRRAAFYAADSLSMSDKLGVTFADFTSRELPVQSALCAFDCAQVLAEWVATVQERVGKYLGVLGKDDVEYAQVPAIMLLEDEDCKLLEKLSEILRNAEAKMTLEIGGMGASAAVAALHGLPSARKSSYGGKILMVTAYMLGRAAVWPVTQILSQSLECQAATMDARAEKSLGA